MAAQNGGKRGKAQSEHRVRVAVVLTDILLLELSGQMSLDKGSFTSASIPYQDKLQDSIQLTLVPTGFVTTPENDFQQSSQPSLGATYAFIHRNKCRLCNENKRQTPYSLTLNLTSWGS